jgi:hypothetical protein
VVPSPLRPLLAVRLEPMDAVFISLMALVVLMVGYVAVALLYKLFKADS